MERKTFQVQQGEDVDGWGRNGDFIPYDIAVTKWDDSVSLYVFGKRGALNCSINVLHPDAGKLAALLLGLDVSKLYRYQEVVTDGEAEYGCTQYVEAESEEEAFELVMQYLVFNYTGNEEPVSYKQYLVDGCEDTIELPGDYRHFRVENLRKFELSDITSEIRSNRIDRYPIPHPDTA